MQPFIAFPEPITIATELHPREGVLLLDATCQLDPEWKQDGGWVTDHFATFDTSQSTPGFRIGLSASRSSPLTVYVIGDEPWAGHCVYTTILAVGQHGWDLVAGEHHLHMMASKGRYATEVWTDAKQPSDVAQCWIVLKPIV